LRARCEHLGEAEALDRALRAEAVGVPRGVDNPVAVVYERVIGGVDFLPTGFLSKGARVARSVGLVQIGSFGSGTGCLVSSRLILTNHHVLPDPETAARATFVLDYREDGLPSRHRLAPAVFWMTHPRLDYTLVALGPSYTEDESLRRGWLPLVAASGKTLVGERVNIVQHPQGRHQTVTLRQNGVLGVFDDWLHYAADTEPGSSGSPVCNDQWQLSALHHAGVPRTDEQGRILLRDGSPWSQTPVDQDRIDWVANEGVRISRIVDDMLRQIRRLDRPTAHLAEACLEAPGAPSWGRTGASPTPTGPILGADGLTWTLPVTLSLPIGAALGGAIVGAAPPPARTVRAAPVPRELPPLPPRSPAPQAETQLTEAQVEGIWVAGEAPELEGWRPEPFPGGGHLLVRSGDEAVTPSGAWALTHDLRAELGDEAIEPLFSTTWIGDVPSLQTGESAAPGDPEWSVKLVKAKAVWARGFRGKGVRVGHPDTGWSPHPELLEPPGRLRSDLAHDFYGDGDGEDRDGYHGTGTASVILSGLGERVRGVAPEAELVPLRVAQKVAVVPSPVLRPRGTRALCAALHHLAEETHPERRCHVVSMSIGWLPTRALARAIRSAWEADLILIAAAGNYTGFVVAPACYPETIALAGCDHRRKKWWGSSRGQAVDFTGPAEDVYRASWAEDPRRPVVGPGTGTSHAAATTAGIAALWLGRWGGWQALRDRYRPHGVRVNEVFRWVLAASCSDPPARSHGRFGLGIVDALAAIDVPLPPPDQVARFQGAVFQELGPSMDPFAPTWRQLGVSAERGRAVASESLGLGADALDGLADLQDELAFHLMTTPAVRSALSGEATLLERTGSPRLPMGLLSPQLRRRL